jgi:SAM-dependent methyltransferase
VIRKAASVLVGFLSPTARLKSAERLHSWLLLRQSPQEIERYLELAPDLPSSALERARLHPNRHAMLEALPKGGTVVEVGTYRGEFSRAIAEICKPDRLHLIDIDFGPFSFDVPMPAERHEGDSSTVLGTFPADYFDWIYIDGDHSYDSVRKDLAAADRVVKPGGLLMCDDYCNWCCAAGSAYGVARAVNEFILEREYAVEGLALQCGGMQNILIRKPQAASRS